jgi:hypothetical protein
MNGRYETLCPSVGPGTWDPTHTVQTDVVPSYFTGNTAWTASFQILISDAVHREALHSFHVLTSRFSKIYFNITRPSLSSHEVVCIFALLVFEPFVCLSVCHGVLTCQYKYVDSDTAKQTGAPVSVFHLIMVPAARTLQVKTVHIILGL